MKFILILLFCSCTVSKPVVRQYRVVNTGIGVFAAKRGSQVLWFGMQKGDSVYVGKIINVSIGRK